MAGLSPRGFDSNDPGWFPHDLDPVADRAGFVRTDRTDLSAEPFLDHRWRAESEVAAPLAALTTAGGRAPQLSFIWHTSLCASTLLSACLDWPGQCLTLKEPRLLVILADLKRAGHLARRPELARLAFSLLGRRFAADEQILIKPSNGANTLVIEAAAHTRGRMLLLYSDCESFILSVARQGSAGFAYVRGLFRSLAADGHPLARWPADDLLRLTDLQLAALVWRMQMDLLEAAAARLGDRARSLDFRLFLRDPERVLPQIDAFLGLGIGRERLDAAASGALFSRDAKRPGQAFNTRARDDEHAWLRACLGTDIAAALRTVEAVFPTPVRLGAPLIGPDRAAPPGVEAGMARAG